MAGHLAQMLAGAAAAVCGVSPRARRLRHDGAPSGRRRKKRRRPSTVSTGPWRVHFFRRRAEDDPTRAVPAQDFLLACPEKVRAMMLAVIKAVADAPPPQFSGGGKWEAMHGEMTG